MQRDNVFRLRLTRELLERLDEEAKAAGIRPTDLARVALAYGLRHFRNEPTSGREWGDAKLT